MKASELKIGRVYLVRHYRLDRFGIVYGFAEVATNWGSKPRKVAKVMWITEDGTHKGSDTVQLSAIQYEYADSVEDFKLKRKIASAKEVARQAERAVKQAEFEAENLTLQKRLAELLGEQAVSVSFGSRNGKPTAILTLELVNALANASKQLVG